MSDSASLQRELHEFIVSELVSGDGALSITPDEDLIKRGIVDSLGVAQLVEFCESSYGIRVADADLVPGNFRSLVELADYVDRKRAEGTSSGRLRLRSSPRAPAPTPSWTAAGDGDTSRPSLAPARQPGSPATPAWAW